MSDLRGTLDRQNLHQHMLGVTAHRHALEHGADVNAAILCSSALRQRRGRISRANSNMYSAFHTNKVCVFRSFKKVQRASKRRFFFFYKWLIEEATPT